VTAAEPATRPRSVFADELAFAESLAARAGELLMERYERVERVDYKSARDVVTEVDHLSEELIIAAIRARYPDDGILAEESGEHVAVAGSAPTSGRGRTWIVDPLDGTINYANGIPYFCVSIGLAVDGTPAVGVIHDPSRHDVRNGRRLIESAVDTRADYFVGYPSPGQAHFTFHGRVLLTLRRGFSPSASYFVW